MKTTFLLAVVAAVAAVAWGAPAGGSQFAPEWVNANTRIHQFRDTIRTAANVKNVPTSDPDIDWARAEVLTVEYNTVFNTTCEAIAKLGLEANSTAGQRIANHALEVANLIDSILTEMIKKIQERTLDGEGAHYYIIERSELQFYAAKLRIQANYFYVGQYVEKLIRIVYDDSRLKRKEIMDELFEIFGIS